MRWTLVRREDASEQTTSVASGEGELEGYMQLWAHSIYSVVDELENDGRGMMWPVGRSFVRFYLSFGADSRIDIGDADPTSMMVLGWWVFGKREVPLDARKLMTPRALDNPKRDRLEQIARLHMDLHDGPLALKTLGLDYMTVIQSPDD